MLPRRNLLAGLCLAAAGAALAQVPPTTQVKPLWEAMSRPRPATRPVTAPAPTKPAATATAPEAAPATIAATASAPATAPVVLTDPLLGVSHSSPWANFQVGSWVEFQRRRNAPDDNLDEREKLVLGAIRADFGELNVYTFKNGKYGVPVGRGFSFAKAPSEFQLRYVGSKEEGVVVGGRKLACTAYTYTRTPTGPDDMAIDATFWTTDAITLPFRQLEGHGQNCAMPGNVVKASYAMKLGDRSYTFTAAVFALNQKAKVGEKQVSAVIERGTIEQIEGDKKTKLTFERTLSNEIPGHIVKKTATGTVNGKAMSQTEEAINFSAKP